MAQKKTSSNSSGARVSRRDNFTTSVIQILYKRAGGKCCKCGATTFGPHTGLQDKYQNIGQAAHIAAAASGGPRYDPKMSQDERTSVVNGLWLCSNCHSMVDKDTSEYTTADLKEMKRQGEERARRMVGVAPEVMDTEQVDETADMLKTSVSATTIVEIRKARSSLVQLNRDGGTITQDEAETVLESLGFINFETDSYRHEVGSELIIFLSQLAARCRDSVVALEVIRQLKFVLESFSSSWSKNDVETVGATLYNLTQNFGKRTKTYQSSLALLKDVGRDKGLRAKNIHTPAVKLMKEITATGRKRQKQADSRDYVDAPTKLVIVQSAAGGRSSGEEEVIARGGGEREGEEGEGGGVEGEGDFVDYLDSMVKLVEAGEESVEDLESRLIGMGYEPNII